MLLFFSTDGSPAPAGECFQIEHSPMVVGGLYPGILHDRHRIAFQRAVGLILLGRLADAKQALEDAGLECLPACRNLVERNFDVAFFGLSEEP